MNYKKCRAFFGIPLIFASLCTYTFASVVSSEEKEAQSKYSFPKTVPPSPQVISWLYAEYLDANEKEEKLTFKDYLKLAGYVPSCSHQEGRDNVSIESSGIRRISIPSKPVAGELHVKVLLIDFKDKVGRLPRKHYENLLFSDKKLLSGSMKDYYKEVSLDKVSIKGSVHGWLRMPNPYSYYTNGESGGEWGSYPRNAPRMAEDAVKVALKKGISFEKELDVLDNGIITALFLIHAGSGAERLHPSIRGNDIWSHKWNLRTPIQVSPGLHASTYLTVPHDCDVGVCSHELGHLAFQWDDFYDPNYDEDGKTWDGSGMWDLMASGSYGGGGARPVHPAALHKMQHKWVETETIDASTMEGDKMSLTLPPFTTMPGYKIIKLTSPAFKPTQYLLLENRMRVGFDSRLPGEGLLVWKVDESKEMFSPDSPGLQLVQADGQHDLENAFDDNQGDGGDPFPGTKNVVDLNDESRDPARPITSFKGGALSGINLSDITRALSGEVSFTITYIKRD